jgi:hypothetical protein
MMGGVMQRFAAAGLILMSMALGACGVPTNSPWMLPGENCQACHNPNGQAFKKPWSVGGTIYADFAATTPLEGADIIITDARGQSITLQSNGAGNFYTAEDVQAPLKNIWVGMNGSYTNMTCRFLAAGYFPGQPVDGACNYCHSNNPPANVPATPLYFVVPDGGTLPTPQTCP